MSLGLFRPFVAFTVGAHILPTFFYMQDNYLGTAFKEKNPLFFTIGVLKLVEQSPDVLVWFMAMLFCVALLFFAVGVFSQISCIVMVLRC